MVLQEFLLTQHGDRARHLAEPNAELKFVGGGERAAKLARVGEAAGWLAHYTRLLRDGYGVHLNG